MKFLQPAQCAYANDLAIASLSLRELMVVLAPALRSIECVAGLNQNFRKCCWVQHGNDELVSLRTWISENCEEIREMQMRTWISETFEEIREMQIVRHAKYVGTMIGPHGHLHRRNAAQKNSVNM